MSFWEYLGDRWQHLVELSVAHIEIVAVAVAIATAVSLALAVLSYRREWSSGAVIGVTSIILTVPSFALFGLLISPFGLGYKPTLVALVLYALLPITRNAIVGLRGVDPAIVEAATGMGIGPWRRLVRIELPLAWPVILAGLRVSTMLTVGIAAIGAVVNGPGLGEDIFRGLAFIGAPAALNYVLSATLAVIVVALLFDLAYVIIGRLTISRGMRA